MLQLIEAEWRLYASLNYDIIGLDNGLSPARHQAMIWTNDGLMFIGPWEQISVKLEAKDNKHR